MGSIHIRGQAFFESLSETVGYKSGLGLGRKDLTDLLEKDEGFDEYVSVSDDDHLRIESVVYEDIVEFLLYSVGRLESPNNPPPGVKLFHKYKHDERLLNLFMDISHAFTGFLNQALNDPQLTKNGMIDPTRFMEKVVDDHGVEGLDIAMELMESFNVQLIKNPWGRITSADWQDTLELKELFTSEGLNVQYGSFFDQRYIDYLHRNFKDIDDINWRKFEHLTAEYFDRTGFEVELGPGRNDDGVDVRVWPSATERSKPPAMIIQCKREKTKVGKVVVKALYADVLEENAGSGLIVTTSSLAPGAKKTCEARGYPIRGAERETLQKWIEEMRVPGAGVGL